ncbi:MAG: hypothetical protein Q8M69_00500 [Reyranella sp.]|nr:hypothetical protein [Reyranella sp.]
MIVNTLVRAALVGKSADAAQGGILWLLRRTRRDSPEAVRVEEQVVRRGLVAVGIKLSGDG